MPSFDLEVPYRERELARRLGARWDSQRRVWYVVGGKDLTRFKDWLPRAPHVNHRSASYVLLESQRVCWQCRQLTRVFGFALPGGHEALEARDDDSCADGEPESGVRWVTQRDATVLSYISHLSASALSRMEWLTPRYRKDFSAATRSRYYMNHCEGCDSKLGDFDTVDEYDAPLRPMHPDTEAHLLQHPVSEWVEAQSSWAPLAQGILRTVSPSSR